MARVAVVDDDPMVRRFIMGCLESQGHDLQELEPTCLFSILSALHEAPPDLLITDLIMPDCPGQTLIRVCREDPHLKHLKILLLTGHGDIALAHFLQTMGSTHYLTKPVAPPELADCVKRFLQGDLAVDPGWSLARRGVVAVVDDSRLSRAYHSACFRKSGFQPVEIDPTGLRETLEALVRTQPDIIVLDYLMPNFNGDALIRAFRAVAPEPIRSIPILVVTAHSSRDLDILIQAHHGVEVLSKPIYPADLIVSVEVLLGTEDHFSFAEGRLDWS
ncbi:MAG: response regulator [Geothrix sp.]|nr:response regulator [Geothrix sp.]